MVDRTELDRALDDASRLLASTREGTAEGEFPPGSQDLLRSRISRVEDSLWSSGESQGMVDEAVGEVYDACSTYECSVHALDIGLVDPLATKETRYLHQNLARFASRALLFGMHDTSGYGVGWSDDDDRSDVRTVCGDYPAVQSEDANGVDGDAHTRRIRYRLESAYRRGGIITLCWHQRDPAGRGFYSRDVNNERIVRTILPGGTRHEDYRAKLRRVAGFLKSLRGPSGESIPVIFRPYHEHLGDWFWWGPAHATGDEYVRLWQFTVHELRDRLHVHNLLWALSPSLSHVGSGERYFDVHPGDRYVDIYGADHYYGAAITRADIGTFAQRVRTLVTHAVHQGKIAALTEVGQGEAVEMPGFYTKALLEPLKADALTRQIVYAAVWRNASTSHHYAPYPGHATVPDFLAFHADPFTVFERDLPPMYVLPSGAPGPAIASKK